MDEFYFKEDVGLGSGVEHSSEGEEAGLVWAGGKGVLVGRGEGVAACGDGRESVSNFSSGRDGEVAAGRHRPRSEVAGVALALHVNRYALDIAHVILAPDHLRHQLVQVWQRSEGGLRVEVVHSGLRVRSIGEGGSEDRRRRTRSLEAGVELRVGVEVVVGIGQLAEEARVEVELAEGHLGRGSSNLRVGDLVELVLLGVGDADDVFGNLAEEDQHDGVCEDEED